MAVEAQSQLFEALKTQIAKLEAERGRALGDNRAVFDQRLEAAGKVLVWLSTVNPNYPSDSPVFTLKRSMTDLYL
jgi:hypothetical protein